MDAAKANRVVATVFQRLGTRFLINSYEAGSQFIFGISEKAPPGQFFDETERLMDGSVRKLKVKDHGGLTIQQFAIICDTSLTDDEAVERIIQLIIKKIDTTRIVTKAQGLSLEEVQAIVQKAIAEDRSTRKVEEQCIQEIAQEIVAAATQRSEPEEPPKLKGLQQRPKKSRFAETAAIDADHKLWTERARLMGIKPPVVLARNRHIDGRWKRHAILAWAQYQQGQPQEAAP